MQESPRVEVTPELYLEVERMYRKKTKMRVTAKNQSPLMRFLAENVLSRGNIVDAQDFMSRFSTTVYLPFRGPVSFVTWNSEQGASSVELSGRITTLAHEAQHVVQMGTTKRSRRRFSTGYVMSPSYRCSCEIEAYTVSLALAACRRVEDGVAYFVIPSPSMVADQESLSRAEAASDYFADALSAYGLGQKHVNLAKDLLMARAKTPFRGLSLDSGALLMDLLQTHV
jgi:hypothetical protein